MLPTWRKKREESFPLMRTGFDRLFEDFFLNRGFPMAMWGNGNEFLPAMDVRETEEAFVAEVEMPGLKPEEIEVKVEEGVLHVAAERKHEKDEKVKGVHRTERYFGRMERHLALPATAAGEKLEAEYRNGVLTLTIPKKPEAKPRSVSVKVK